MWSSQSRYVPAEVKAALLAAVEQQRRLMLAAGPVEEAGERFRSNEQVFQAVCQTLDLATSPEEVQAIARAWTPEDYRQLAVLGLRRAAGADWHYAHEKQYD